MHGCNVIIKSQLGLTQLEQQFLCQSKWHKWQNASILKTNINFNLKLFIGTALCGSCISRFIERLRHYDSLLKSMENHWKITTTFVFGHQW